MKNRVKMIIRGGGFFLSFLGILSTSSYASDRSCSSALVRTELAPTLELISRGAVVWEPVRVTLGAFGGYLIQARLHQEKQTLYSWAPEGGLHIMSAAVGSAVSSYFGQACDGENCFFPSREEQNGRIRRYNSSPVIGSDLNHSGYLHYLYFDPGDELEDISHLDRAKYFLLKFLLEKLWPFSNVGYLFFHDANYHMGLNFLPLELLDLVLEQVRLALDFVEWLERNEPELAAWTTAMAIPTVDGSKFESHSMSIAQFIMWMFLMDLDFGNGNFLLNLKLEAYESDLSLEDAKRTLGEEHKIVQSILGVYRNLHVFTGGFRTPEERMINIINSAPAEGANFNRRVLTSAFQRYLDETRIGRESRSSWKTDLLVILRQGGQFEDVIWKMVKKRVGTIMKAVSGDLSSNQ